MAMVNSKARVFSENWSQKWFGFWGHEVEVTGTPFSLDDHVNVDWHPHDISYLIEYLRSAPVPLVAQANKVKCGLCDEKITTSCYRSDGVLLWHDALAHMVEKHSFQLPDNFVAHIRAMDYVPPTSLDIPVQDLPWPK